jgi:tetratricopeptide (TPR) repeat protein
LAGRDHEVSEDITGNRDGWLEDFTIDLTTAEIHRLVEEDAGVVYTGSKPLAAAWMTTTAVIGGALGGLIVSYALWSSFLLGIAALAAFGALFWLLNALTLRLFGRPVRFLALWNYAFGALMGVAAMWGAQLVSPAWAYGVSAGAAFFFSVLYRGPDPHELRNPGAWEAAVLVAPLAAAFATYAWRNVLPEANTIAAAAQTGALAAFLLIAPMMVLLARLWDISKGLRRIAVLYLHNDAFAAKAVAALDLALKMAPDDPDLLNLRGIAWSRTGDMARAEADWQNVQRLKPRSAEPLVSRGVAALRQGELDKAIASLEAAVKRKPKHVHAHTALGLAFEQRGVFVRAIAEHERAFDLAQDARTLTNLASARLPGGDYEQVLQDCAVAIDELDSPFGKTWIVRAHALAAMGMRARAIAVYELAAQVDTEENIREEAERAIEAPKADASEPGTS